MNLNELIDSLSRESSCVSPPPSSPVRPSSSKFYQMECGSNHYYTPKLSRQLPLREIEGFCRVQMRHTTSKFKQGKLIQVAAIQKPLFMANLRRSVQLQPRLQTEVRSELLARRNHVIRLPRDTGKSITSHCSTVGNSVTTISPLPEVED